MIYKELDAFQPEDKFTRAGRVAEEQMAFYLKRFFADDPEVLVLNSIRLESGGDAAQVDHLVIHPHGLIIVESKSVHGSIQIKDDGQWIRWFNGNQSRGIRSPVTQARMQERFFRQVLGKASNNPALIARLPIDLMVAISDTGIIRWPASGPLEGVCKADQIPDRIAASKAGAPGVAALLSPASREKIAAFLVASHKPLDPIAADTADGEAGSNIAEAPSSPPTPEAAPNPEPAAAEPPQGSPVAGAASSSPDASSQHAGTHQCKHCGSDRLEIRYAYTYHFSCLDCEKNTAIHPQCPACSQPAKLRKQKKEFFCDCAACNSSTPYYQNA